MPSRETSQPAKLQLTESPLYTYFISKSITSGSNPSSTPSISLSSTASITWKTTAAFALWCWRWGIE